MSDHGQLRCLFRWTYGWLVFLGSPHGRPTGVTPGSRWNEPQRSLIPFCSGPRGFRSVVGLLSLSDSCCLRSVSIGLHLYSSFQLPHSIVFVYYVTILSGWLRLKPLQPLDLPDLQLPDVDQGVIL